MSLYKGRALVSGQPKRKRSGSVKRVARLIGAVALAVLLAHLPWERLTDRFWVLTEARVEGHHYLGPEKILDIAGIVKGQRLFDLDRQGARQALLLHPRIARAQVSRYWLRGVKVRVVERVPVLLVRHGQPWEMDSTGTLLAPLAKGVVADAPLLAGADFAGMPEGVRIGSHRVRRGLAWARALSDRALMLISETSEIDVSDTRDTMLLLLDGTRVLAPAWPPGRRNLSALRVVLADLKERGTPAQEIDLRFEDQVIVRPAEPPESLGGGSTNQEYQVERVEDVNHGRAAV